MKEKMFAALLLLLLVFSMTGGVVHAQRATPTSLPTATPDSYPPPPDPDPDPDPDPTVPAGAPSVPGTQTNFSQVDSKGSIRGAVFEDVDGDGQCQTEDAPVLSDVPIVFQLHGGPEGLPLYSGDDGTFGLVAASFGEWQVSAKAPSGYVVTSDNPVTVSISGSDQVAMNAVFCLTDASSVQILLPESGAAAAPISMITIWILVGAFFLMLGLVIYRRLSQMS